MSKPSTCPAGSNWVVVLQQDDCAPDSLETFERHFPDFAGGLSVESFKAQALRKEEGISVCWVLGNLELSYSADDPFYSLKFNQAEATDLQAARMKVYIIYCADKYDGYDKVVAVFTKEHLAKKSAAAVS